MRRELQTANADAGITAETNTCRTSALDTGDLVPGHHTVARCDLAGEIVSPGDHRQIARKGRPKIDIKISSCMSLPDCKAILTVEQKRFEVATGLRTGRD